MANRCPDISRRHTNRIDDDRCLYQSSHRDTDVDDSHMPSVVVWFVPFSIGRRRRQCELDPRNLYPVTVIVGSDMDFTHWADSIEHDRTVSVRPSRNKRVIDASYVKLKRPVSYESKCISTRWMSRTSSTNAIMSQLKCHLNVSIRREFTFLHKTLAIDILHIDMQIDICGYLRCLRQTFLNDVVTLEPTLMLMKTKERQSLHFQESTIWAWSVSRRWNEECHVCCPVHHIYREACDRLRERRQAEVRTYPNVKVSSNRMYSTMWPEIGASAYRDVARLLLL